MHLVNAEKFAAAVCNTIPFFVYFAQLIAYRLRMIVHLKT